MKDFADALRLIFNLEIQNTHFGPGNTTVSLEGSAIKTFDGNELKQMFRTYVSDEKRQDCRVVHANTWKLIQEMRRDYNLLAKDSKDFLMELMDGCGKQYRCGTALFLMAFTANHFGIPIDRMISCPGHGKGPVDAENGVTKTFLKIYFRLIKIWGLNKCDEGEHYLSACMVDENAKKVSFAESLVRLLKDPKRKDGRKSNSKKYASREEKRKLKDRDY